VRWGASERKAGKRGAGKRGTTREYNANASIYQPPPAPRNFRSDRRRKPGDRRSWFWHPSSMQFDLHQFPNPSPPPV